MCDYCRIFEDEKFGIALGYADVRVRVNGSWVRVNVR